MIVNIQEGNRRMDYFWIRQDRRYLHAPVFINAGDIVGNREDITIENEKMIADASVAFVRSPEAIDFVDILDTQFFLVSDRVKEVLKMFEPSLKFKMVCILDNLAGGYANYHLPIFPQADCLSEKSIILPDKTRVKRLVLDERKLGCRTMLKVAGLRVDVILIRLDVMESLLRRKIRTFEFERVEMEMDETGGGK